MNAQNGVVCRSANHKSGRYRNLVVNRAGIDMLDIVDALDDGF